MSGELCQCLLNKDVTRKADTPKFVKTTTIGDIHVTFLEKYPRTDSETNRSCCVCQTCCSAALIAEGPNSHISEKESGLKKASSIDLFTQNKPKVLFVRHGATMQTEIRRHRTDLGSITLKK